MLPDLQFADLGFAALCTPTSDAGKDWVFNHLLPGDEGIEAADSDQLWPILIEPRYLEDIVLGARADGLICHG